MSHRWGRLSYAYRRCQARNFSLSAAFMEYNIKNRCSILYKIRGSVGLSLGDVFVGVCTSFATNKRSTARI